MLSSTRHDQCAGHGLAEPTLNAWSILGRAWQHLQRRRRLRATEKLLLGLSDRTLKDIGIHRSEVHSLVRNGDRRFERDRWPLSTKYY